MNILNWFDILKNQVLSNTSLGSSMDWNNPEIIEEEDDCKMWLKGLFDILDDNLTQSNWGITFDHFEKMPENLACAIKDYYTIIF